MFIEELIAALNLVQPLNGNWLSVLSAQNIPPGFAEFMSQRNIGYDMQASTLKIRMVCTMSKFVVYSIYAIHY